MPCYTPLKGYHKEGGGFTGDASKSLGIKMEVACGQCLGCRLDYARMWSMRIVHEAQLYSSARGSAFITLTYDDEHLPSDWSLCLRDFQLFMKSLRKSEKRAPGDGVRFFMCGEYGVKCRHGLATEEEYYENGRLLPMCGDGDGCSMGRPHFHAVLFNISFPNKFEVGRSRDDSDIIYYSDDTLMSCWHRGFVSLGDVTMQSAGYVARYAVKKITGKMADCHYITLDDSLGYLSVCHEISTKSNRPGIGAKWYEKYKTDVFPSDEVPVPGQGVFKKVPGYYNVLLERDDPALLEEVKNERMKYMRSHKEEFTPERLLDKYKVKTSQIKLLKRKI